METIPIPIQKELKKICWGCLGDAKEIDYTEHWSYEDGCKLVLVAKKTVKCTPCNREWYISNNIFSE